MVSWFNWTLKKRCRVLRPALSLIYGEMWRPYAYYILGCRHEELEVMRAAAVANGTDPDTERTVFNSRYAMAYIDKMEVCIFFSL